MVVLLLVLVTMMVFVKVGLVERMVVMLEMATGTCRSWWDSD